MVGTELDIIELLIGEVAQQLVEIEISEDMSWYIEHLAVRISEMQSKT